jgi:uncharacterized integral membrane protein (TIGR00697 family)
MTNNEKIYTGLCIIFTSLIVLGNLIYQKFVILQIPFHKFELSVGAVLYPLTFLITDLITELYGKEKTRFCIRFAMFMNIVVAVIIVFMDHLPATTWSKIDDETFHKMFSYYGIAFIGSITACYTAQVIDVHLYVWIRKLTKQKYLWLRSNGSTCFSLFIDTTIVIGFMTMFGIFPIKQMWPLILNSYSWKLFFTICSTPLFYISISSIKYFSNLKKVI